MFEITKSKLSDSTLQDLEQFKKTGEDAIWLLLNGDGRYTTDQIIKRFETSNIAGTLKTGLKTANEWADSVFGPKEVRNTMEPFTKDGEFSAFALMEKEERMGKMRYPLVSSFSVRELEFGDSSFSTYEQLKQRITEMYGIKILEDSCTKCLFKYKRAGIRAKLKNFKNKTFNLCRRMFKKQVKSYRLNDYKGVMHLKSEMVYGSGKIHKISEQERMVKIIDGIAKVTVKKYSKANKYKLSKQELYASRLITNILVSRAVDYGDIQNNRKIERCLSLQLSNVLARLNLSPEKIDMVTENAVRAATRITINLGLQLSDVVASMKNAGYVYQTEPKTIREALVSRFVTSPEVAKKVEEAEQQENLYLEQPKQFQLQAPEAANLIDHEQVIGLPDPKEQEADINTDPVLYMPGPEQTEEKPEEKVKELKQFNVQPKNPMIKRSKAIEYIDKVITSCFDKAIDSYTTERYAQDTKEKKANLLDRQCNFLEHASAYYVNNKDRDNAQRLEAELSALKVADNNYAHDFSNAFVELRNYIITSLFGEADKIEKPQGKNMRSMINEFVAGKYGRQLSSFVNEKIKKDLKVIFKEIDEKKYIRKSFVNSNETNKDTEN